MESTFQELAAAMASLKPTSPSEYCLLWIDWWPLCMQKSEWASWVQAVGAVITIAAAFLIASMQQRHERVRQAHVRFAAGSVVRTTLIMQAIALTSALNVRLARWRQMIEAKTLPDGFEADLVELSAIGVPDDAQLVQIAQEWPAACQRFVLARSSHAELLRMLRWTSEDARSASVDSIDVSALIAKGDSVKRYLTTALEGLGVTTQEHVVSRFA